MYSENNKILRTLGGFSLIQAGVKFYVSNANNNLFEVDMFEAYNLEVCDSDEFISQSSSFDFKGIVRKDKELIQVVIDSLKLGYKKSWNSHGICGEIWDLKHFGFITHDEYFRLNQLIQANKPTETNEFKEFIQNIYWKGRAFWWNDMSTYPETREIRIAYLKKLKTLV